MGPEELKGLVVLLEMLGRLGAGSLWAILLAVVIGPWLLAVLLAGLADRQVRRVAKMYENNAHLAENYEKLATNLQDVVITNTAAMTTVCDAIDRMERTHQK